MADHEVGIYEAKSSFASLVREAESGYPVTITRHGKPIARLVPIESNDEAKEIKRQEAIEELRNFHKGRFLRGLSIREMIEEGRK